MPLSIIWLVTSFAIRLLVVHVKLVILLRARAKARFRGSGVQEREGGRNVVLADKDFPPTGRPCEPAPACANSRLQLKRKL
jgi:hypothetical protein